jgi:hypothetical protein
MSGFEKWSVLSTSFLTAVTGIVYLWMKYFMEPPEAWAVINHPLQPWVLKAHILVAPLLVFALGFIAVRHVWRHFITGVPFARRSGLTAALSLAPMIVTGYLIQAVTAEGWLLAIAIAHIVTGLLYSLGITGHAWFARKAARPSAASTPAILPRASTAAPVHRPTRS